MSIFKRCSEKPLSDTIESSLQPVLLRLVNDSHCRDRMITGLGRCWVELSKFILDLYIPSVPIDPAAIQHCSEEFGRLRALALSSEIHLHSQIEQRITGHTENSVIGYLKQRRDEISAGLVDKPPIHLRDLQNTSRLRMFWQEVTEFKSQVIASKIDTLTHHLESGEENAPSREMALQQAIFGFLRRLNTIYTEYSDLIVPLQLALLYLSMGIRLVAEGALNGANTESNALDGLATSLVTFPSIQSSASLLANLDNIEFPLKVTPRHSLLRLAALNFEICVGVDLKTHMSSIHTTYEQVLRLWLIDRARKDDTDTASQSLYKSKAIDDEAADEVEAEEREFLALFPQFENIFQQETQAHVTPNRHPALLLDSAQTRTLVSIHLNLIDISTQPSKHVANALGIFSNVRVAEAEFLLESHMPSLSEVVDQESRALQFAIIHQCLSRLKGTSNSAEASYNFYIDANIGEISKAGTIVKRMNERLDELVEEWPDHMVLQSMKKSCDVVLNLNLLVPVAKVLCALEQLLMQSEDWENFSHKENSLKSHLQDLTGLIIEWRRLELSSWQTLLQTEAKAFGDGASEWWFHLYDSTVRGSLDLLNQPISNEADQLANHLTRLCPLLDGFIQSSPLGQYHSRLQLLRSFSQYVGQLALIKPLRFRHGLERVKRLLYATTQFYEQFDTLIASQLTQQRTAIETDLRGFIKLASWKDTNVLSLKQSAQKTHRQLYKCVRQFRNVMRQPILQWLQVEQMMSLEAKHLPEPRINDEALPVPHTLLTFASRPSLSLPSHLSNLDRTYEKFVSLIADSIRATIQSHTTTSLEDFAVEILSTAKMLSTLSVPTNEPADKREKIRKGRLLRKRRAWSDLLKELKRAGFAANIKPDDLTRLRDVSWIREQPSSVDLPEKSALLSKSEGYLSRLYGILPDLRQSLANHHSDVTTRELQRGINFLESGFDLALHSKSW